MKVNINDNPLKKEASCKYLFVYFVNDLKYDKYIEYVVNIHFYKIN